MELFGCYQADGAMMVLLVIPGEKLLTEGAGLLNSAEFSGEARAVFQGFELRFRERVVIADMGPAMAFKDPQIRE